jgi:hypothetical protein
MIPQMRDSPPAEEGGGLSQNVAEKILRRERAPRKLVRQEVPIQPITVTERTSEAALGIPPWRLRELCVEHQIGTHLGRQCIVRVDELLAAIGLEQRAAPEPDREPPPANECDRVLRAIGRRRR